MKAEQYNNIFEQSIQDYHVKDHVDAPLINPYQEGSLHYLAYLKNWIDTVQWHLEDIIRSPSITAEELVQIKRRIDQSNQHRTDTVEKMDDQFMALYGKVDRKPGARLNSETPAWLIDRMSILMLKIYHMREQTLRTDADSGHISRCEQKLAILLEQKADLAQSLDELFADLATGAKYMKVYRQMKMYNDNSLNPILYNKVQSI
jgi:hypothetical protein